MECKTLDVSELDLSANEITLDGQGVSEFTYAANKHSESITLMKSEIFQYFPHWIDHAGQEWDIIGETSPDFRNYFERTISLTLSGPPKSEIRERFNVPDKVVAVDCHTIKFQLSSKREVLKVYQEAIDGSLPAMPSGVEIADRFGFGRHFNDPEIESLRDVYFFCRDDQEVSRFFDIPLTRMSFDSDTNLKFLGLCWNAKTREAVKLKRYLYPGDLLLEQPENI